MNCATLQQYVLCCSTNINVHEVVTVNHYGWNGTTWPLIIVNIDHHLNMTCMWGAAVSIHTIKALRGRRGITPLILNLSTRRQWEVKFMPWLFHPQETAPVFCMISDFCCKVDENSALLGCYAASSGNSLPMFRDNLSVPCSSVKNPNNPLHCTWLYGPTYQGSKWAGAPP